MPTIRDILTSGQPLQLDLLTAIPDSSNPSDWQLVSYPGYQPFSVTPVISVNDDGLVGVVQVNITTDPFNLRGVVAAVVSYQGQYLFSAPVGASNLPVIQPVILLINFIFWPVER